MKKLLISVFLFGLSWNVVAGEATEIARAAVNEIVKIAQNKDLPAQQRKDQLFEVIQDYVDLPAASQRVLAQSWRKASKEEKIEFVKIFRRILTNTYFNLLQNYSDEQVVFGDETIKKDKYATVESIVLSDGIEVPVTYRLLYRNDKWKLYDFVAEGISLVRSFNSEYLSIVRKVGVQGLNEQLMKKLDDDAVQ